MTNSIFSVDTTFSKSKLFLEVISFVDQSNKGKVAHFQRTCDYLFWLKHDADESMLIAAYMHDIERAFRKKDTKEVYSKMPNGFLNQDHLKEHQEKGAEIAANFLESKGASVELIEKVTHLISKHEFGGDEDQNILKDADSMSFFETNADHFIKKYSKEVGVELVRNKFDWMFNRISSVKAKEYIKPLYVKVLQALEHEHSKS